MTKKKFFELAAHHGIAVEYTPGGVGRGLYRNTEPFHIMLDAPQGKRFAKTTLHIDGSIQGLEGTTKTNWAECIVALQELIEDGFDSCTDPDCDFCHPLD